MLEIELNKDQLAADFSVAALSPVTIEKDSKKELCQIADTLERRYGELTSINYFLKKSTLPASGTFISFEGISS